MKPNIRIHPLTPLPLLLFFGGQWWELSLFLGAVLLHEAGHVAAIFLTGNKIAELILSPTGATIRLEHSFCPYKKEIFIALAGPFFNLIADVVTLFRLRSSFCEPLLFFFFCNALLFFLNLLPIGGLDGERALFHWFSWRTDPFRAEEVTRFFSGVFLFLLSGCSVYLLLATNNPSLGLLTASLGMEEAARRKTKRKKATKIS